MKTVTQGLRCCAILCSIDFEFVTDILGQPIGPILKGQAVQELL